MFNNKSLGFVFSFLLFFHSPAFCQQDSAKSDSISVIEKIEEIDEHDPQINQILAPIMESLAVALKSNPRDYRLHYILSRSYLKLGMEDMAKEEEQSAEASGREFKDFVLAAFRNKVLKTDFSKAMTYYPLCLKYFPEDTCVVIIRSIKLHSEGKYKEEEELLEKVLQSGKREKGILSGLASVRLIEGQYRESVKLFDQELKLFPDYEPALYGKAKALEKMHHYRRSLEIASPLYLEDAFRPGLSLFMANLYCHLGAYRQALQPTLVSLAVSPQLKQLNETKRLIQLIWPRLPAQVRQNELKEVGSVLDKTVFAARLYFALGDALQKAGFAKDAIEQFENGLRFEKRYASAHLHLADIYLNHYRNKEAAMYHYLKYLIYAGGDPKIQTRLVRLGSVTHRYNKDIALRVKYKILGQQAPGKIKSRAQSKQ